MERKKLICLIIICVLTAVSGLCSLKIALYLIDKQKAVSKYEKLSNMTDIYENNGQGEEAGADAVYGDQLLTLSTCDYTYANGRIVLVAKEVS